MTAGAINFLLENVKADFKPSKHLPSQIQQLTHFQKGVKYVQS